MEFNPEDLNKKPRGRPYGKIGPYKPRNKLNNDLNLTPELNEEELNLIQEIAPEQIEQEVNYIEKIPEPDLKVKYIEKPLDLNNLKNVQTHNFNLPQVKTPLIQELKQAPYSSTELKRMGVITPEAKPINKKSEPTFKFNSDSLFNSRGDLMTNNFNSFEDTDDSKERQEIIQKLKKYQMNFKVFENRTINYDGTTPYLKGILEEFRGSVGGKNTHTIFKGCYIQSVKGFEFLGSRTGMKLYGLSDALSKNEEVDNILKEIECEYINMKSLKPEHRLLLVTASSAMVINAMNKRSEILQEFGNTKVSSTTIEEFNDL